MSYRRSIFIVTLFLAVTLLISSLIGPGTEQTAVAQVTAVQPSDAQVASDYLIGLPMPTVDIQTIPAGMEPAAAQNFSRQLQEQAAAPVLQALANLQHQGKVMDFRLDYSNNAIAVMTAENVNLTQLLEPSLPISFISTEQAPECAQGAGAALDQQVASLSLARDTAVATQTQARGTQANSNPSINVNYIPGATYAYISGTANPNVGVTMRILRSGQQIVSRTTTSSDTGWYSFYPSYLSCPTSGYDWSVKAGDVVEVTAAGSTVSTTVVDLFANIDASTDVISGITAPGRTIEVELIHRANSFCIGTLYEKSGTVASSGSFSVSMASMINFNRAAYVNIYALDANGNSTFIYGYPYRIIASSEGSITFSLPYNSSYTLTHKRGSSTLQTSSGVTDARGYGYSYLANPLQGGDVLTATGGGKTVTFTYAALSATLDAANNRITGTTAANRAVSVSINRRDNSTLRNSCTYSWDCMSGTANGSGNFTLNSNIDVLRGDYGYLYAFDSEGNYQYLANISSPLIVASPTDSITGFWREPYSPITVVLRQGGTTYTTSTNTNYDGSFYAWPGAYPAAGDIIELGNGVITETMTVQNATARLNNSGQISGTASNGKLIISYSDHKTDYNSWYTYCQETAVSGNSYNVSITNAQPSVQDSVSIYSSGADGHYSKAIGQAFGLTTLGIGSSYVSGKTETTGATIDATLSRGGSIIASRTAGGTTSSYFSFDFGTPIAVGDVLDIQTSDGDSTTFTVPNLTVTSNASNNSVQGTAPANKAVYAAQTRNYNGGYYAVGGTTLTNNSGSYSLSMNGFYYSHECTAADSSHPCNRPYVYYYAPTYTLYRWGAGPINVSADTYEGDNSFSSATAYAGTAQHHTFHLPSDQDWASFTVTAANVGQTYFIDTTDYGWGMAVTLNLFDSDGSTLLASTTGYEWQEASLAWQPTSAGTYYIQLVPPDSYYTQYCDAQFDLVISKVKLYLPFVNK